MDILTTLGQESRLWEMDAMDIWHRNSTSRMVETPKEKPARVDGIIEVDGTIKACYEIKCRKIALQKLLLDFKGEWLVTAEKVLDGIDVARKLQVPFIGILYLEPDKKLLHKTIWRPSDGVVVAMRVRTTDTQKTINGGVIARQNAFIDMRDATVLS